MAGVAAVTAGGNAAQGGFQMIGQIVAANKSAEANKEVARINAHSAGNLQYHQLSYQMGKDKADNQLTRDINKENADTTRYGADQDAASRMYQADQQRKAAQANAVATMYNVDARNAMFTKEGVVGGAMNYRPRQTSYAQHLTGITNFRSETPFVPQDKYRGTRLQNMYNYGDVLHTSWNKKKEKGN